MTMKALGQQGDAGDLRVRLEVLAWTAARQGHDDVAAYLFGAVAAARDAVGAARPRIDARQYDQARAAVRSRLDAAPCAVAWDEGYEGYRMSPGQVVRRATMRGSTASRAGSVHQGGSLAALIPLATASITGSCPDVQHPGARGPTGDPGALSSASGCC